MVRDAGCSLRALEWEAPRARTSGRAGCRVLSRGPSTMSPTRPSPGHESPAGAQLAPHLVPRRRGTSFLSMALKGFSFSHFKLDQFPN